MNGLQLLLFLLNFYESTTLSFTIDQNTKTDSAYNHKASKAWGKTPLAQEGIGWAKNKQPINDRE